MKLYNTFDDMLNKITSLPFVKDNILAIYAEPKFLKEDDKWISFYYELKSDVSSKECLAFEKEVSKMFCEEEVCCDISHVDFASLETKQGGSIWEG